MPLLRKAGIRSPWQPGPLQANTDPLRQAVVIGALVPSLLLGSNTRFIGRPAPPEDVAWPARPLIEQQGQQLIPGAAAWMPYPVREGQAAPPDRLAPTQLVLAPPAPLPGAFVRQPSAARLPNTDPLRPTTVQADAPDATLAQSATIWLGRLSRDEDTSRPARPAFVQGPPVPMPGARALGVGPVRATPTDPIRPALVLVSQPPIPGAVGGLLCPPIRPPPAAVTRFVELILGARPSYTITARGSFIIEAQPALTIEGED